ncbi:alpha-ketoglutarate dehydrogenase component 4 [Nematostella vectensis]|uniref:alpha-ketoglutarate dehydrogenase component 4 n=1 Tax=Nematostella vectensis TaxID=45351 RepID=UPI00138FA938|nr:alpha-ketoglutarate dehydrogenase component 4 [Nematostella vectensis]
MASAARQIVRKHIPRIKFPARIQVGKKAQPSTRQEPELSATISAMTASSSSFKGFPRPTVANMVFVPVQNTIEEVESISTLPARFRRQPMSREEMEYIERGGPE